MTASHFALLMFKLVAGWTLASFIVGGALCWLITRGKMDSHRRQHGSGSDQPVGFRGGSQRGSNIDHSTLV